MLDLSLLLLQRALDIVRYGNGLGAGIEGLLARLGIEMARGIPATMPARRAERELLFRRVVRAWEQEAGATFRQIEAKLERELPEVAQVFRDQASRDMGREPPERAGAMPSSVEGLPVGTWLNAQRADLLLKAQARLRAGVGRGDAAGAMAGEVEAVAAAKGRQAATLARTAATKAANEGYAKGLRDAGVERYVWVAILDDRTTVICRGLNGRTFRLDDPDAPKPPAHWNCRSHIEPVQAQGQLAGLAQRAGLSVERVQAAERQLLGVGVGAGAGVGQGWARNPPPELAARLRAEAVGVREQILGRAGARRFGLGLTLAQVARRETGTLGLAGLTMRVGQ